MTSIQSTKPSFRLSKGLGMKCKWNRTSKMNIICCLGLIISHHTPNVHRFKIQFTFFLCNFWIFTSLSAISASLLLRARLSLTVHCLLPLKLVSVSSSFFSRLCSCLFKFFIFDCFSCTFFCSCLSMSAFLDELEGLEEGEGEELRGMGGISKCSSRKSFSLSCYLFLDSLRSSSFIFLSSVWISVWFTGFP